MKYVEKYNVRWHDTDANREVHPSGVLMFMQETGNRQFEAADRPLDKIRDEEGVGFILSRIAIEMKEPIHAYEDIFVETFTCESRGYTFPRGWEIKRRGKVVARAMSQWALVRVADKSLVRSGDFPMSFGDEPELQLEMPLRFRVPSDLTFETVGHRTIAFSDIDYNMHMNNTKYPDMLCDFLPDPAHTRVIGVSLAYRKEAAYGDTLTVERAVADDGVFYIRTRHGEETCLEAMVKTQKI
ncbi:MAG: hypothetical protein E7590_00595 [Ruminococcaceae bacterium]|nr:hypothetical protein [Oscillospiraceae bacterium]